MVAKGRSRRRHTRAQPRRSGGRDPVVGPRRSPPFGRPENQWRIGSGGQGRETATPTPKTKKTLWVGWGPFQRETPFNASHPSPSSCAGDMCRLRRRGRRPGRRATWTLPRDPRAAACVRTPAWRGFSDESEVCVAPVPSRHTCPSPVVALVIRPQARTATVQRT